MYIFKVELLHIFNLFQKFILALAARQKYKYYFDKKYIKKIKK